MFQELKKIFYQQIEEKIQIYNEKENSINKMQEEIKELEERLANLNNNVPSRPVNITGLKSLFTSKKKKKENEEKRMEYRKYNLEKSHVSERISRLKLDIADKKRMNKEMDIETLNKSKSELDQMTDEQWVVKMINTNPKLSENIEFMKDIVNINLDFLKYDKTNNKDLYISVLGKIQENNEEYKKNYGNEDDFDIWLSQILEELNNPKQVEEGKYKIPVKYLFESIRMDLKNHSNFASSSYYIDTDGKYPKEVGEMLEQNYESKDYYFLIHRDLKTEKTADMTTKEEKLKSICKYGLQMSTHTETDCLNSLGGTTVGNQFENVTFLDLISKDLPTVIIRIPKERIDDNYMIWGTNEDTATYDKPTHLLPEYIAGYIIDHNYYSNPYPLEEREKYTYFYGDEETELQNNSISM